VGGQQRRDGCPLGSGDDVMHSNASASTPKGRFRSSSSARRPPACRAPGRSRACPQAGGSSRSRPRLRSAPPQAGLRRRGPGPRQRPGPQLHARQGTTPPGCSARNPAMEKNAAAVPARPHRRLPSPDRTHPRTVTALDTRP
jgi:hypothetical protein